jgi:6-phosphogluconolactonase
MPAVRLLYAGAGDAVAIYQRTDGTEGLLDGSGDLTLLQSVPIPGGLRAFTFSPDKYRLHVVTNEDTCTSFKVDQATGELTPAGGEPVSLPISPCYMTTDRTGRYVLLASYREPGAVASLAVGADGCVTGPPISVLDDLRFTSHFISTDPTNRFAFVPCVAGADHTNGNAIHQLSFSESDGVLAHNGPPIIPPPTGPTPVPRFDGPLDTAPEPEGGFPDGFSANIAPPPYNRFGTRSELGPRHFIFHPFLNILYTANEQGNSVSAYRMDASSGLLTHLQTIPTVPDEFKLVSHCAEIKTTPDGKWLFAPNRALPVTGCCSVAVFAVDSGSGGLQLSEICLINDVPDSFSPQHIALDPTGQIVCESTMQHAPSWSSAATFARCQ